MIDLAHVQKAAIAPHEDVVVADNEDETVGGGLAGDGSDGWDWEGEESGDDCSEGFDHLVEVEAGGELVPRDVDAVAVSDGD